MFSDVNHQQPKFILVVTQLAFLVYLDFIVGTV